jgi:hypothetical protein
MVKPDVDTLPTVPDAPPAAGPDRALDPVPPDPRPPVWPLVGCPDGADGDEVAADGDDVAAEGDDVAADADEVAEQPERITAQLSVAAATDMVSLDLLRTLCLEAIGGSSLAS